MAATSRLPPFPYSLWAGQPGQPSANSSSIRNVESVDRTPRG
jgi:hypothetical protein